MPKHDSQPILRFGFAPLRRDGEYGGIGGERPFQDFQGLPRLSSGESACAPSRDDQEPSRDR